MIGALGLMIAAFGATAMAQCGGSFGSLAAAAAAVKGQSHVSRSPFTIEKGAVGDESVNPSIVGLWHIRFMIGNQTIQEAFQVWNAGGTEVHNPNVDPRGGTVCLGAWREAPQQSFRLTHRVWNYDTNGNFLGTIHLTEVVGLGDRGSTHSGTFTLAFYDPSGNFLFDVTGNVVAERIFVD
jgi:hypothetical protein